MLRRDIDGQPLTFHLAGINNQNFLMRDEETGTYWQQITGIAISGPLAGRRLPFVPADEMTFALWKSEEPRGTVLSDVPKYVSGYAERDWDVKMRRAPTVLSYAEDGLKPRDLMLGIRAFGASRAFPWDLVIQQKLIQDNVGSQPVLLVVGPDNQSVRAFRLSVPGVKSTVDFYRIVDAPPQTRPDVASSGGFLVDAQTGSGWNFQGCAVTGKLRGTCLERVEVIKDYWFDWRHYNADTTVYGHKIM